jgi:hypothetical protein
MAIYEYEQVVRSELLYELHAAGITDARLEWDETTAWVTTDAERAIVDAVVAAHDAAAIAAAEEQARADDTANRDLAREAVATLTADIAALTARAGEFHADATNMPANLSAAQVRGRLIQIEDGLGDLALVVADHARVLRAVINYLAHRGL